MGFSSFVIAGALRPADFPILEGECRLRRDLGRAAGGSSIEATRSNGVTGRPARRQQRYRDGFIAAKEAGRIDAVHHLRPAEAAKLETDDVPISSFVSIASRSGRYMSGMVSDVLAWVRMTN
jgi:hypothetical protein